MFSNFKDFIAVIQEGLQTNNSLKHKLQEVQRIKNLFKSSPKSSSKCSVNYDAGSDLLEKYQKEWVEIHNNTEQNAEAAEKVDKCILEIQEITNARLKCAMMLSQNLSSLPALTASVAQCIDSMKNLSSLIEIVEDELIEYEDYVEREKLEKWKLDHHYHLSLYKEKKMQALDQVRCELVEESKKKSLNEEKRKLEVLKAKQENSSAAFRSDVAAYLSTGNIPSVSSSSQAIISLEQVELETDNTDLEEFLSS